jgi:hypothetical protein
VRVDGDGEDLASPSSREAPPALAASLAEQAGVLQEVLDGFSPRHRALLELRLVDGEQFGAIAVKLGYASAETARLAFWDAQARLLVKLRARGIRASGEQTQG